MPLTMEENITMNYYLTDVALGLLGNEFFDIDGQAIPDFITLLNHQSPLRLDRHKFQDIGEPLISTIGLNEYLGIPKKGSTLDVPMEQAMSEPPTQESEINNYNNVSDCFTVDDSDDDIDVYPTISNQSISIRDDIVRNSNTQIPVKPTTKHVTAHRRLTVVEGLPELRPHYSKTVSCGTDSDELRKKMKQECEQEYDRMANESDEARQNYLFDNKHRIAANNIQKNCDELLFEFHQKERNELIAEGLHIMDFLNVALADQDIDENIRQRWAVKSDDILKFKDAFE